MKLQFTKMHSLGNDYIYIDCLSQRVRHPGQIAKSVSDRRLGVGAEGLILIGPSDRADFEMRMYNADGAEGRMCHNGIGCVGKFVYDSHLTDKTDLEIDTKSGVKKLTLAVRDGEVASVAIEMGKVSLRSKDIPVQTDYDTFVSQPMLIHGEVYLVTCVSMGSPHAVIFCDEVDNLPLEEIGPLLEYHDRFPDRINAEFVKVVDRSTLSVRVWERESGEAFACVTGACAGVAAAVENGHCDPDTEVTVHLLGGDLKVICRTDATVLVEGPAVKVFDGIIDLEKLQ